MIFCDLIVLTVGVIHIGCVSINDACYVSLNVKFLYTLKTRYLYDIVKHTNFFQNKRLVELNHFSTR